METTSHDGDDAVDDKTPRLGSLDCPVSCIARLWGRRLRTPVLRTNFFCLCYFPARYCGNHIQFNMLCRSVDEHGKHRREAISAIVSYTHFRLFFLSCLSFMRIVRRVTTCPPSNARLCSSRTFVVAVE